MWDALVAFGGTFGMAGAIYWLGRSVERQLHPAEPESDFDAAADQAIALTRVPQPRQSIDDRKAERTWER